MKGSRNPLTEAQRVEAEARLAEGWPVSELIRTGLITKWQGQKHFKGRGWTLSQTGTFSQQVQRLKVRL